MKAKPWRVTIIFVLVSTGAILGQYKFKTNFAGECPKDKLVVIAQDIVPDGSVVVVEPKLVGDRVTVATFQEFSKISPEATRKLIEFDGKKITYYAKVFKNPGDYEWFIFSKYVSYSVEGGGLYTFKRCSIDADGSILCHLRGDVGFYRIGKVVDMGFSPICGGSLGLGIAIILVWLIDLVRKPFRVSLNGA